MNTRLKQFLAAENISQAQFADSINVVRASVSHVLSGRNNPSFDFIRAMMQQYPNLNIDWLMFGKGRMYKDAARPEPVEELLFSDLEPEDDLKTPPPAPVEEKIVPAAASTELNTLTQAAQTIVNQRKVSKILILFDDGTYQEM